MYTGKSSRNPNSSMIWSILLGVGFIAFGIYLYFDLAAWENSNEEMHLNSILWGIYDIAGKIGVAGFFSIIGLGVAGAGIKKSIDLKKLQQKTQNKQ